MLLELSETCHTVFAISATRLRHFFETLICAYDLTGPSSETMLVVVSTGIQQSNVDVGHVGQERWTHIFAELSMITTHLDSYRLRADEFLLVWVRRFQHLLLLIFQTKSY